MSIEKFNSDIVNRVEYLLNAAKLYSQGHPIITDAAFDALESELRLLDKTNKYFDIVQSRQHLDKVYHIYPMLSQQKALTLEALSNFICRNEQYTKYFAITPKLDGMSIEFCVKNHSFYASSRGDGEFGEDYTNQVIGILGKQCIDKLVLLPDFIVRGECILIKKSFEELNKLFISEHKLPYSNARNGTAGIFNNKADGFKYLHFINIFIWDILSPLKESNYMDNMIEAAKLLQTYSDKLLVLLPLHFSGKEIIDFCSKSSAHRDEYDFDIDGFVIRIDDNCYYESLGRTASYRCGSIAYKFPAQQGTIEIKDIEWNIGSRDITPVAIFNLIQLAGANISRASLHSIKNMFDLKACKGSILILTRQGDVIPKLSKNPLVPTQFKDGSLVSDEDVKHCLITKCPSCDFDLNLSPDFTHLTCSNIDCFGKIGRRIEIFAKAIGIKFLGKGIAEKLAESKELNLMSPLDIFAMDWTIVNNLLGKGVAIRLKQSIDEIFTSKIQLENFIAGLSLGRLGISTIRTIFQEFGSDFVISGKKVDFSSIHGFGLNSACQLSQSFEKLDEYLKRAKELGLKFVDSSTKKQISNKQVTYFCVTGALSKNRVDFIGELEIYNWIFNSSVSSVTKYLITNDSSKASVKLNTAKKLGVQIISEEMALELAKLV